MSKRDMHLIIDEIFLSFVDHSRFELNQEDENNIT